MHASTLGIYALSTTLEEVRKKKYLRSSGFGSERRDWKRKKTVHLHIASDAEYFIHRSPRARDLCWLHTISRSRNRLIFFTPFEIAPTHVHSRFIRWRKKLYGREKELKGALMLGVFLPFFLAARSLAARSRHVVPDHHPHLSRPRVWGHDEPGPRYYPHGVAYICLSEDTFRSTWGSCRPHSITHVVRSPAVGGCSITLLCLSLALEGPIHG